jgi:hypothetical protein
VGQALEVAERIVGDYYSVSVGLLALVGLIFASLLPIRLGSAMRLVADPMHVRKGRLTDTEVPSYV